MQIREAIEADRNAVIALWREAGLVRPWNDPEQDFRQALDWAGSTILIGQDTAALLATVMVGFDGHRGWVYYLATAPSHRHHGYGRAMMDSAMAWLKKAGARKIQLMVRTENESVVSFYKALGFEQQNVMTLGRFLDAEF